MLSRRLLRRLVALAAALAIVAAQSASMAYACTRAADASPGQAAALAPCAEHRAADPGPRGADTGNLCEVHCQAASPPMAGMQAMAPPPALSFALDVPPVVVDGEPAAAPEARGNGPPPRDRYCRLQL